VITRLRSASLLCASAAFLFARPASAQQRELRTAAAADAVVSVVVENASVTVTGWNGDEVVVLARGGSLRGVQLQGDRTRVRVRSSYHEDLDIRVPRGARVDVRTQNGDLSVSGVTGSVYLESMNGDFRVEGDPRLVEIEALSGDIHILGRPVSIKAATVSGDITIPRARGVVDASTTSGDIFVTADGLERGNFSTTSGTALLRGSPARNANILLESASGTVESALGEAFPAEYELSTVTGDIESTFGPRPTRVRYGPGMNLQFSTGAGARIRASSVSGDVRIR
jgi:DUF4097 and DUF4098 domain-containing protein YvlB